MKIKQITLLSLIFLFLGSTLKSQWDRDQVELIAYPLGGLALGSLAALETKRLLSNDQTLSVTALKGISSALLATAQNYPMLSGALMGAAGMGALIYRKKIATSYKRAQFHSTHDAKIVHYVLLTLGAGTSYSIVGTTLLLSKGMSYPHKQNL